MPVIYLDVLLAVNLLVDFLLLTATAFLLHLPTKRWRLVLAAGVGSASAGLVFLPALPLPITLLAKLLTAAILVAVAFRQRGVRLYIKQLAVFFGVSVMFAGVAFGLWTWFAPADMAVINGVVYYDVPPVWLVVFSLISYGLLRLYDRIRRQKVPAGAMYRLRIDGGAGMVELNALYDTGHHVTEQFSGSPVVIVQYAALAPSLTANLRDSLSHLLDGKGDTLSAHAALKSRLRLIPFHSMGGEGVIPAFRPVGLLISEGKGNWTDIGGAYVAVSRKLQSREYEALVGSDLMEWITLSERSNGREASSMVGEMPVAASPDTGVDNADMDWNRG